MEAAIYKIWDTLVALFMAPGRAMMEGLASTQWGQDWGASAHPDWTVVAVVSLLFWCVLFSLVGAMDDQIRRVTRRNTQRRRRTD